MIRKRYRVFGIGFVGVILFVYLFNKGIADYRRQQLNICYSHLLFIASSQSELEELEADTKMTNNSVVDLVKLASHFKANKIPSCPSGGKYRIGVIKEWPRCTIHGFPTDQDDIHLAAHQGDLDKMKKLLKGGVRIETETWKDKWRPLHCAAFSGRTNIVIYLVSHGADKVAKTSSGQTAYDLANDPEIKRILDEGETRVSSPPYTLKTNTIPE